MASLADGWRIQVRVIKALMIRELSTRFGRENIGFLWMIVEPLLFPALVALMWRLLKGPEEHGISVIAFVVTGYVPLTFFRHAIGRCAGVFTANSSLMYHRQIRLLDFILVRFLIEMIGSMTSFSIIGVVLIYFDLFPIPYSLGYVLAGWGLYCFFTLAMCLFLAPLSEMSEVIERFLPITTYVMIPFSGTFNQVSWLSPSVREPLLWTPFVNAMEMIRFGVFGHQVDPYFNPWVPFWEAILLMVAGLGMCRYVRRRLVVE